MAKELDVNAILKQFPTAKFESRPYYSPTDDSIQFCLEGVDQYAELLDNTMTIYRAFDDHRVVGFKVENVRSLMETGWNPIETAPKDGTPILGYADGAMMVVQWLEVDDGSEDGWYLDAEDGHWDPTHWMPLPEPPCAEAGISEQK